MSETFKKYVCKITKEPIFWSINSIDKPTRKCLESYTFEDVNFTPNFIDQFTLSIVADSENYTILQLSEIWESEKDGIKSQFTKNIKYYLNSKNSKILKNGYLLIFDLDIYLTYFFDFFDKYYSNIYVKRAYHNNILQNEISTFFMEKNDPLLDFDDCNFYPITQKWDTLHAMGYKNQNISGPLEIIYIGNSYKAPSLGNSTGFKLKQISSRYNKARAFAYQLADGTYFFIVDIGSGSCVKENNENFKITFFDGDFVHNNIIQKKNAFSWLQNKFVGVFNIPFINYLPNLAFWNALGYYENGDVSGSFKKYYDIDTNNMGSGAFCFFMKPNEPIELIRGGVNSFQIDWGELGSLDESNTITDFYTRFTGIRREPMGTIYTPNYYILAKSYYEDFKKPVLHPNLSWLGGGYLTFDGSNFNFSPSYKMGNINNNIYNDPISKWDDCYYLAPNILTFYGTYNIATDSYKEYINSVKSQQNTGLQVAKQQAIFSGITGGLSNLINMAGDVADRDGLGFLKSTLNLGSGIASNILKYQNKERQINAKNEDTRRVSKANNISSSVSSDDMNNKRNGYYQDSPDDIYFYNTINIRLPNKYQCAKMHDIIGKYGFYIDWNTSIISEYYNPSTSGATYTILDFETDEINLRRFFSNVNNDTIEAMKLIINNSFIFWDDKTKIIDNKNFYGIINYMKIPGWNT